MRATLSSLFKSFKNRRSTTFIKDLKNRALNVVIDSDVILHQEPNSFSFLSEYMKVDRGILDMISFVRAQVPINTHIFAPHKTDTVAILDSVMSTGFTVNSCTSENEFSGKNLNIGKILSIVKILSSFPTGRYIFFLSDIEELLFLVFVHTLTSGHENRDSSIDHSWMRDLEHSSIYERWSNFINLDRLINLEFSIDAIFLKSDALSNFKKLKSYLFSTPSRICVFNNYLNILVSLVISKILSKDKFISFLKYSHDHFGESLEDILSVIKPVLDCGIIKSEDIGMFTKMIDISLVKDFQQKNMSMINYTLEDNSEFVAGFISSYLQDV